MTRSAAVTFPDAARRIERLRGQADDLVGSRTDILGSMVGIKIRGGIVQRRATMTFLVREKIPPADLRPKARIGKRLTIDGSVIPTDVVVWPTLVDQNLSSAQITFDGAQQGSLSCFGRSNLGDYGVTCAHCLMGRDGRPATPAGIQMYSDGLRRMLPAGDSVFSVFAPGTGQPGDFGFADCGLFDLDDPHLVGRAQGAAPLPVVDDITGLLGERLVGLSALRPMGAPYPDRTGQVVGVQASALGERCDLVIAVDPPGTYHGDSGMLWLTEGGAAAAIHARGEVSASGSRVTAAMSANRVARLLGVNLALG